MRCVKYMLLQKLSRMISKLFKTNRKTNIKDTDRKNYDGKTYKYCFDCSQWTLLENFSKDSSAPDCYKRSCKKTLSD